MSPRGRRPWREHEPTVHVLAEPTALIGWSVPKSAVSDRVPHVHAPSTRGISNVRQLSRLILQRCGEHSRAVFSVEARAPLVVPDRGHRNRFGEWCDPPELRLS
jgi:hypothetical protein